MPVAAPTETHLSMNVHCINRQTGAKPGALLQKSSFVACGTRYAVCSKCLIDQSERISLIQDASFSPEATAAVEIESSEQDSTG